MGGSPPCVSGGVRGFSSKGSWDGGVPQFGGGFGGLSGSPSAPSSCGCWETPLPAQPFWGAPGGLLSSPSCDTPILGGILGSFAPPVTVEPPESWGVTPAGCVGAQVAWCQCPQARGQGDATCSVAVAVASSPPLLVLGAFPLIYPLLCNARGKLFLAGKIWGGGGSSVWGGCASPPTPAAEIGGSFPVPPAPNPSLTQSPIWWGWR